MANIIAKGVFPGGSGTKAADELPIPLNNVTNLKIGGSNAAGVTLTWTDPNNDQVKGIDVNKWAGTRIIKKEGSAPVSATDGTLVVDSKVKNQYSSSPYTDQTIKPVPTYYLAVPYTKLVDTFSTDNIVAFNTECTVTYVSYATGSRVVLGTSTQPYGGNHTYTDTTPTKAQTEKYTYTHSGWSFSNNDTPVSGILNNVTDNIEVVATFTATIRSYPITFYDYDGTVLATVQCDYDSIPVYPKTNPSYAGGWTFSGWSPSLVACKGPASYYATYTFPSSWWEETCPYSWEEIDTMLTDGTWNSKLTVGMKKILPWGSYGPQLMKLGGKNVDTMTSGGKAKLTWINMSVTGELIRWYANNNDKTVSWSNGLLRSYLSDALDKLPDVVKKHVVAVNKYSYNENNGSAKPNEQTSDSIWVLSCQEAGWTGFETSGLTYEIFNSNNDRIHRNTYGQQQNSWTRSRNTNNTASAVYITASGGKDTNGLSVSYGVSPCFCQS